MAYTETALYLDSVAYSAVAAFAASTSYTVGQIVRQLTAPSAGNERCFVVTVAGTSSTEPAWTVTKGAKTTSGTVTFVECTALPALNGDSANTPAWLASQGTIPQGAIIKNVAADHYFICTTTGTGGTGSEPSWNTTTGATTVDSSVTWTCLGAISSFTTRWAAAAKMLSNPVWNSTSWLVNANMTVFVGDDHAESGSVSWSPGNPCQVLCVDHTAAFPLTSANLKTTAALTAASTNTFWNGAVNGYVYGLQIKATQSVTAIGGGNFGSAQLIMEQCLISITSANANYQYRLGDSSGSSGSLTLRNCTFNTSAASQSMALLGIVKMEGCSLTGSFGGSANQIFAGGSAIPTFTNVVAEGCDFATNVSSGANLVGAGAAGQPLGYMLFKDCLIPSNLTNIFRGGDASMTGGLVIDLNRCDSGATNYRNERHACNGTQTTSTTVVRSNGAKDGSTAISNKIATSTNAVFPHTFHLALPLVTWNSAVASNRTVTVYGIVNDSRVPNNDEVWFDTEYLGSSSNPQGSYNRGNRILPGVAAALTADSVSAWDSAATARANTHAYSLGDVIKVASNSAKIFFCTTAGTSAGSEPGGYATAVDGGSVTDGGAVFRAGCRFSQALTLSSPQPQQAGYLYAYPRLARASVTYFLDPLLSLS